MGFNDKDETPYVGEDHVGEGVIENADGLLRRLNNRQIQWIAIGG